MRRPAKARKGKKNRRVGEAEAGVGLLGGIARVIGWTLGCIALIAACIGLQQGWELLRESPQLTVKQIEVSGVERVDAQEIEAYADVAVGAQILDVDLDRIALALRRHPWVREVSVRRSLPDKLSIEVVEHRPAILVSLGRMYVADSDGTLFKRLTAEDLLDFPIMTGLKTADVDEDAEFSAGVIRESVELGAVLEEHEDVLGRVEELHWDPDLFWSIVTRPPSAPAETLRIYLGREPLRRLSVARQVVRQLRARDQMPAVIWVDGIKNPDRVHVRLSGNGNLHDSKTLVARAR